MIEVTNTKTGHTPVVCCDECGDRIEDASMAIVLKYGGEDAKDGRLRILYAHKGRCDSAIVVKEGEELGSVELSSFLRRLCYNVNLPPTKLLELDKIESEAIDHLP